MLFPDGSYNMLGVWVFVPCCRILFDIRFHPGEGICEMDYSCYPKNTFTEGAALALGLGVQVCREIYFNQAYCYLLKVFFGFS